MSRLLAPGLLFTLFVTALLPGLALAAGEGTEHTRLDLTRSGIGYAAIAIFVFAYMLVIGEEFIHLRKSKPVIIGAGLIWGIIGWVYASHGMPELAEHAVRHNLLEYAELMLFLLTIVTAVSFHNFLGLPPVIGMLTGLGYLQFFGFYLKKTHHKCLARQAGDPEHDEQIGNVVPFDIFSKVARAEWDTLLFFYGVVLCVGGLGFLGYLAMASELMYNQWGATSANITVGVLSAIVDNIPVMFAVLTMNPDMSTGQWLLVTMTAGVGGSLLSIGSAAGVALMGQARGKYTFFGHLKWTPVIAIGYAASIAVHMWINASYF